MAIIPEQCRAARALVGFSQTKLSSRANVARATVNDFERGARTPHRNNLAAIQRALESAGVEFLDENGGGAGVRLKKLST